MNYSLLISLLLSGVLTYGQLANQKNKIVISHLDQTDFVQLKKILAETGDNIQDTIIIKYDFNKETCWDLLDQKPRHYIKEIIKRAHAHLENLKKIRPSVSFFEFREEGSGINKIKKWNEYIRVDSASRINNLIISEKSTCGNSVIILPTGKMITIKSDAHFEAANYSAGEIEGILRQ